MTAHLFPIACDIVAITFIAALYFHRHQRRDLLLAYVALNIGILSVTAMLTTSTSVGVGLGLGLFGILSIIRLRSDRSPRRRSPTTSSLWRSASWPASRAGRLPRPGLIGLLVAVMYVADHPRLLSQSRRQLLTLDSAIPDEAALRAYIGNQLGVDARHFIVQELDFVRDLTIVDVRYRVHPTFVTLPRQQEPASAEPTVPDAAAEAGMDHARTDALIAQRASQNGHHPRGRACRPRRGTPCPPARR